MISKIRPNRFWLAPILALLIIGAVATITLGEGYNAVMKAVPADSNPQLAPIEAYLSAHGGEARFGKPLSSVFVTSDGYAAQWFERGALTYDPGAAPDQAVQMPNVGWIVAAAHCTEAPFARISEGATNAGRFFPETGHSVPGTFLEVWNSEDGLQSYGYPISEAYETQSGDTTLLVQYFERARLEMTVGGNEIRLGLLGVEARQLIDGSYPARPVAPDFYPPSGGATPGYKAGHAPDYSWVSGRITGVAPPVGMGGPSIERPTGPVQLVSASKLVMKIFEEPTETALPNGAIVGTSVHNDVSPPLSSIVPRPATPECSSQASDTFLPEGPGWNPAGLKEGQHVVLYGHLATPDASISLGSQGRPYIVERIEVQSATADVDVGH